MSTRRGARAVGSPAGECGEVADDVYPAMKDLLTEATV